MDAPEWAWKHSRHRVLRKILTKEVLNVELSSDRLAIMCEETSTSQISQMCRKSRLRTTYVMKRVRKHLLPSSKLMI